MSTPLPDDSRAAAGATVRPAWTTRPERGNVALLKALVWVALHLGRPVARALLIPVALYFFFFGGPARRASRAYLARVLPQPPTWRDGFRHVFAFAQATLDRVYLLNGRFDLFDLRVCGDAHTRGHAQPGLFMLGAHMGSFEAIRAIGHRREDIPLALLMYEDNARKIGALLDAINPKAAQEIIALGRIDAMLRLRDRLDQGVVAGMLADRTLADDETIEVPFLGTPAAFPVGPFRLAAMLQRPVLLMCGLYLGGNRYEIHFEPIFDFSQNRLPRAQAIRSALETYVGRLEHHCRQHPYNWFNFYDFWNPCVDSDDQA